MHVYMYIYNICERDLFLLALSNQSEAQVALQSRSFIEATTYKGCHSVAKVIMSYSASGHINTDLFPKISDGFTGECVIPYVY